MPSKKSRKPVKKSRKPVKRKKSNKSKRKKYMTKKRCKSYLQQKIRKNISEHMKSNKKKFKSIKQAIAVSYSQIKRSHKNCKKHFKY
tara:strand:- start:4368 stop:4628 length:261 start_codon:yes stop_codon:yes gene_type:complete